MLPTREMPKYEFDLISGGTITLVPYTMRQKRNLLLLTEYLNNVKISSKENLLQLLKDNKHTISKTINSVIEECVVSKPDDISIEKLPEYDTLNIFRKLRAISDGETLKLIYTCNNDDCKKEIKFSIDITKDFYIEKNLKRNEIIDLGNGLSIKLKDISLREFESSNLFDRKISENNNMMIALSIDEIYLLTGNDEKTVYKTSDYSIDEILIWIDINLTENNKIEIQNYIKNKPSIYFEKELLCEKCKTSHKVKLDCIIDFFL